MGISDILNEKTIADLAAYRSALLTELKSSRIIIFGSGNLGRKMGAFIKAKDMNFVAFADNNRAKWGTEIDGIQVWSPSQATEELGRSGLFIVGIWSPGNSYAATKKQLVEARR